MNHDEATFPKLLAEHADHPAEAGGAGRGGPPGGGLPLGDRLL